MAGLNGIKLISLDLDDTLLRSDLTISLKTRSVLKKAAAKGVAITINTGRVLSGVKKPLRALGLNKTKGYAVCGNGTIIYESDTARPIYETKLDAKTALTAFNMVDAEGFPVLIYEHDVTYVSFQNEFADIDEKLTGIKQIVPPDFRDLLRRGTYKLVIPASPHFIGDIQTILAGMLGETATLFTSKPYYLEILPPGVNKGSGLAKVAEMLGIKREEVMAFGDSMNDEAMVKWAGCGVAMLNGEDRIKKIARFVTPASNNNDGVAAVVERYLLKGEALPPPVNAGST
ncbi:MAG: Cof-type HAD-IIB family hydrolase [Spirochaetaceae bacterium]|jgi:Cof subfamily protein (haloacid dehalogenase superfamily)|nr:Cof-type HAD-IIB family hydrolase [Spirochaetaceae bacterium]